ncbi:MAG: tripartite tricarboxylate transporter TctB family protein [Variibacter sp.]
MTQAGETAAERPPLFGFIRNPQDFFGGLALAVFSAIAYWASSDLPGMQGIQFGPGTAPRLFIVLLILVSLAIMLHAVVVAGPQLERFAIRGPLFITGAVLLFAATIRSLGLIPSSFLLVVVSSMATPEMRWLETIIWGAILAGFCAILFPYALNLPMPLWPGH